MGNRAGTQFSLFDDDEPTPAKKTTSKPSTTTAATTTQPAARQPAPKQESGYKINIAGNGMGNRAGTQFSLFDDEEQPAKQSASATARAERKAAKSFDWDF